MTNIPLKFFFLASSCLYFLSFSTSYADDGKSNKAQDPERITVYGRRSIFSLRKEVRKLEVSFYDLFNEINIDPRFDIVCGIRKDTGSNIPRRGCEPRYLKTARTELTRFSAGGAGLKHNVSPQEIEAIAKRNKEKSLEILEKLIDENPELRASLIKLQEAKAVLKQRESED
jgi:hypothetical protein